MIITVKNGYADSAYEDGFRGKIAAIDPAATLYRVPDTHSTFSILGRSAVYGEDGTEVSPAVPPMTEAQVQAIEEALTPAQMLTRLTGMSIADIQTALGI